MLLSFIIPTYNRGEIFNRTFSALLNASQGLEVEIIVVNDYKKAELILPIKKNNVRVVNNPKQGAASARNYGASLASGQYLVFLDDDIILNRKNIETIVSLHQGKKMESYLLNWVYPEDLTNEIKKTKFGNFLIETDLTSMKGWRGGSYWSDKEPFKVDSAASCCLVLHNEVFREVGGYNEKFILAGFEDYDFPLRLMNYGMVFFVYPLDSIYHNESDRVTLKSFLTRKMNASITRRIGVDLGYKELAISYSVFKKYILHILKKITFLIYVIAFLVPNNKILRPIYYRLVGILTAVYIYKGYTHKDKIKKNQLSVKVRILNFFRQIFKIELLEKWLVKRSSGKKVDSFFAKLTPNYSQYSQGTIKKVIHHTITYEVDVSDYIGHHIYFGFSSPEMDALFSLIKESSTIVDIGANYGFVTLNAAMLTGENGKVYSFEPDFKNYKACLKNIGENTFKNIILENIGLGNSTGDFFLEVSNPSNRGGNSISSNPSGEYSKVKIIRLDDYFVANNIKNVDLIKIDVEGFELQIVKGASTILEQYHPVLFIEVDDNNLINQGDNAAKLLEYLVLKGYNLFIRADNGSRITSDFDFRNQHFDLICK